MRITVTQEHIEKGEENNACHCPIALAVKESMKIKRGVSVFPADLVVRAADGFPSRGTLPDEAQKFIRHFDAGKPVQPFTFELELSR